MALFAQHIDATELNTLVELARRYELDRHDPLIRTTLRSLDPAHPSIADHRAMALVRERIQSFVLFHRDHPWRVMPQGLLDGPFTIATQVANGAPIRLTREQLARHALVVGGSGSGKTTLVTTLTGQLLSQAVKLVIPDYKDDFRRLAATDGRFIILDEHARFNPLQRPAHLAVGEFVALITDEVARVYYGHQNLKRYLSTALLHAFQDQDQPCLADLPPLIERAITKHSTYTERDAANGLLQRLQRFAVMYPAMFSCRNGITSSALFQQSLYLPLRVTSEAGQLLLAILVQLLFQHQRGRQRRGGLEYVLLLDEGMMTWSAHQTNIEREPLLASLMTMVRESGIGMIVTSTTADVAPLLQSNAFVQIALNVTSGTDTASIAKTFEMTLEEQSYFTGRLQRGECVVKLGDTWRYPVLATFPRDDERKDVTDDEWAAAIERTNALAPTELRQIVETVTIAPIADISPNAVLTGALRAFVTFIGEHEVPTVIETYDALRLKPMQGDRLQKKAKSLGLIIATRITIGGGRGKEATALTATPLAYKMLGIKRPHLGRGSGPQHAWLLKTLRDRIPHATIEVNGADIGIAYNAVEHAQFIQALRATAATEISFNGGESITVECELDPSRTLRKNLDRDKGFSLVVVGVRRAHLAVARRIAQRFANTIVIDIFALIDRLQEQAS